MIGTCGEFRDVVCCVEAVDAGWFDALLQRYSSDKVVS